MDQNDVGRLEIWHAEALKDCLRSPTRAAPSDVEAVNWGWIGSFRLGIEYEGPFYIAARDFREASSDQ